MTTKTSRHETPDVAELRRALDDMRALATREGVYNGNRAVLDIIARVEPLLDDADALRAELAHMTEARDNARAEVDRLSARVEAVREWATACATQATDYDEDTEQQIEDGREVLRILDATPGGGES